MNISDLSTDAQKAIIDVLYATTATQPATRQALAVAANVERAEVGELLTDLRLRGYLILEDERGCWFGTSLHEYEHWRTTMLIPAMLFMLKVDQAMYQAALEQFGQGRAEAA